MAFLHGLTKILKKVLGFSFIGISMILLYTLMIALILAALITAVVLLIKAFEEPLIYIPVDIIVIFGIRWLMKHPKLKDGFKDLGHQIWKNL